MLLIDRIFGFLTFYFHSNSDKEVLLRSILRNYPRWGWGHYLLSQVLFQQRDWSRSFVSIAAAKKLKVKTKFTAVIEAKIYMQVGRPGDAISTLLPIFNINSDNQDLDVIEELVAAYMQMEDFVSAGKVLNQIHSNVVIPAGLKVAKEFIATKLAN